MSSPDYHLRYLSINRFLFWITEVSFVNFFFLKIDEYNIFEQISVETKEIGINISLIFCHIRGYLSQILKGCSANEIIISSDVYTW